MFLTRMTYSTSANYPLALVRLSGMAFIIDNTDVCVVDDALEVELDAAPVLPTPWV